MFAAVPFTWLLVNLLAARFGAQADAGAGLALAMGTGVVLFGVLMTAVAMECILASAESAREVSTTGALAPTSTPARAGSAVMARHWETVTGVRLILPPGQAHGRGGVTGAAPLVLRDHISVPTIPALARARRHLDACDAKGVTLITTGGLRSPSDFAKALALGADGVALANSALQAIGCLGMRACHTNNCPVGIATQKPHLRDRLPVDIAAERRARWAEAVRRALETGDVPVALAERGDWLMDRAAASLLKLKPS